MQQEQHLQEDVNLCGIVGIINKNALSGFMQPQLQIFQQMLFVDELRGHHGTGMFWNTKRGGKMQSKGRWIKTVQPANQFLVDIDVQKAMTEILNQSSFAIGHNRFATKGKVDIKGTHPHVVDHITLIHNGTLWSHDKLCDSTESDSYAIAHSIAKRGAKKTLKMIHGAFALVWYDSKQKTLNICRNDERPLHYVDSHGIFYIASESRMLDWIVHRNKQYNCGKPTPFKTEKIYSFDIEKNAFEFENVEFRQIPIITYNHNTQPNWNDEQYYDSFFRQQDRLLTNNLDYSTRRSNFSSQVTDYDWIDFLPIEVISRKHNSHYVKGVRIQNDKTKYEIVKYYSNNKTYLQQMVEREIKLSGEIYQHGWKDGEKFYVVKGVRRAYPSTHSNLFEDKACNIINQNGDRFND